MRRKALIILGMHRSGTSAFAGVLSILGLDFGADIMASSAYNEKGFFENNKVYNINEEILQSIDSSWDNLSLLPQDWWKNDIINSFKNRLKNIIHEEFHDQIFAVKDPRICFLMPLWLEMFEELSIDPFFIIVIRHPLEVAHSLKKRNGFSLEKSTLLWTKYLLDAELNSRAYPRIFLAYDELLTDHEKAIRQISNFLPIEFPYQSADRIIAIKQFLEPNLKHYNLNPYSDDQALLDISATLYDTFIHCLPPKSFTENERTQIDHIRKKFLQMNQYFYNPDLIQDIIKEKNEIINLQKQKLAAVINSPSWKITLPLRVIASLILNNAKRFESLLKILYFRLPLPNSIKSKLKITYFKYFSNGAKYSDGNPDLAIWEEDTGFVSGKIKFTSTADPLISIVIPVYNHCRQTRNCLQTILNHSSGIPYEIIIVDDCSDDESAAEISKIEGINLIHNEKNMGFIESCNLGAKHAQGRYLVFLNNDTLITRDCLGWLYNAFKDNPDAGLVGAKLIYPNGRLQEAGGIAWKDGSAYNYGNLDEPGKPQYNYLREVDYCSGACIMIPRVLFFSLGMFDQYYAPAYYEDVDLAFKVQAAGKKVLYQPLAQVFHYGGATSGKDVAKGIKQYQIVNQEKFYSKWIEVLSTHRDYGVCVEYEKERSIRKRLLVIDSYICLPDQDAGSLRMLKLLQIFQEFGYKVTFYPDSILYPEPYVSNMRARGIEILTLMHIHSMKKYLAKHGTIFDFVLLSRVGVADQYIDLIKKYCRNAKIIFDTVDLHFLREEREAELKKSVRMLKSAERLKNKEISIAKKSDITFVVSYEEKKILENENRKLNVKVVSTIHDVHGNAVPFQKRKHLLFIGGFKHPPNIDAMIYFVGEVFPLIQMKLEDVKVYIVGSNPTEDIKALISEKIIVTGYVPNIEPYLRGCRVSLAPLRFGAGVKGKINTYMSYGLPAVMTPVAAEAMFLTHEKNALIATDSKEFAEAVVRLYTQEELWNTISRNGLMNIRKNFSYDTAKETIKSLVE